MVDSLPARFSTANRYIALPDVRTCDCAIETLSFMHSGLRAAVELHGNGEESFLKPVVTVDGREMKLGGASWDQLNHWIPRFSLQNNGIEVTGIVFTPLEHKGFIWILEFTCNAEAPVDLKAGWRGCWQDTYHVTKLSKPMKGAITAGFDQELESSVYMEFCHAAPMFALGLCPGQSMEWELAEQDRGISYSLTADFTLAPGETKTLVLHMGIGLEQASAIAAALDLRRHGWQNMLNLLLKWLEHRTYTLDDERLTRLLNLNSFYNYFYSQANTIDAEQLVVMTARSSRHPGSAAYKDREAMLWSLPAVLRIDPLQARRMLEYAFTVQLRNVGVYSRFIDGVVLEPGFSLDEICSPIRALWTYVYETGDMSIVFDRRIQTGLNRIQQLIASAKHPKLPLYETFLSPSAEVTGYPYLTYDNVLVWRSVRDIAWIYDRIRDIDRTQEMLELANSIRKAIMAHCVVKGPFGDMFAWSVDLAGNFELGDEPAGSLQLLAWLDFCPTDLPAYKNTVQWIHSEQNPYSFVNSPLAAPGCRRGNHPSILAVANDLLSGRKEEAYDLLKRVSMDDMIACEFVSENTGDAAGGLAFAAAAGYLAYAIATAEGMKTEVSLLPSRQLSTIERLSPHPPEIRDSVDTGRM